jgi:hypothetical protein
VGGAAGTGVVLATRGKEVRLGRGAPSRFARFGRFACRSRQRLVQQAVVGALTGNVYRMVSVPDDSAMARKPWR